MAKKIILIVLILVIGCFIVFVAFDNTWFTQPLKASAGKALFNSTTTEFQLECSHDFLGITNHGELFEFYEYDVSNSNKIVIASASRFPKFENGLYDRPSRALQNIKFSSWQSTPVRSQDKPSMVATEFGNLRDNNCSKQFVLKQYLQQPGSYYAFFSAYPIGSFIYVWVPIEQKLFLIKNRG